MFQWSANAYPFYMVYIWLYSQEHGGRFLPGFGHSPNPGLADDSKPGGGGGGGSIQPGSGGWPSPWAICWWPAGGQLSKAGGRGGAWMFCVDMAPCWRRPCHVLAWGGGVLSQPGGWSEHFWPLGLSQSQLWACLCENGQILRPDGSWQGPERTSCDF